MTFPLYSLNSIEEIVSQAKLGGLSKAATNLVERTKFIDYYYINNDVHKSALETYLREGSFYGLIWIGEEGFEEYLKYATEYLGEDEEALYYLSEGTSEAHRKEMANWETKEDDLTTVSKEDIIKLAIEAGKTANKSTINWFNIYTGNELKTRVIDGICEATYNNLSLFEDLVDEKEIKYAIKSMLIYMVKNNIDKSTVISKYEGYIDSYLLSLVATELDDISLLNLDNLKENQLSELFYNSVIHRSYECEEEIIYKYDLPISTIRTGLILSINYDNLLSFKLLSNMFKQLEYDRMFVGALSYGSQQIMLHVWKKLKQSDREMLLDIAKRMSLEDTPTANKIKEWLESSSK